MQLSRVSVGLAVRAARDAAGLSSIALADRVNMSASSLSRTENGLRSLEFVEAVDIASAVGIDVPKFLSLAETFEREGSGTKMSELQMALNELQQLALKAAIEVQTSN